MKISDALFEIGYCLGYSDVEGWCCQKHTPTREQVETLAKAVEAFRLHRRQACACKHESAKALTGEEG